MSDTPTTTFEEDSVKERLESEQLLLYLGSFDGPIDMLLGLARDQKVDLTKISILALATQYLDFIDKARALRLEVAADYLVMAAWLAYLKSRLLIPQEETKQAEPSAQDLADALQFQLRRLEAMRKVANDLFNLPRLGFNVFARGEPEGLKVDYIAKYDMTLYDMLKAYGDIKQRQSNSVYKLNPVRLFSVEEAIDRVTTMLGGIPKEWVSLFMFLPGGLNDRIVKRSAVASTFGGALEMAKRGLIQIQQETTYGPIYIRQPSQGGEDEAPIEEIAETSLSAEDVAHMEAEDARLAEEEAAQAAAAEDTQSPDAPLADDMDEDDDDSDEEDDDDDEDDEDEDDEDEDDHDDETDTLTTPEQRD